MSQTVAEPAVAPHRPGAAPEAGLLRRLLARVPRSESFWGWAGPLVVTLLAGVQRFWHLDRPHKLIFDETYYVKEGVSYLKYGVEMTLKESLAKDPDKRNDAADLLFRAGNWDIFSHEPDRVVHPMVGKWMIAFGEWLFGPSSSLGWRFSVALCGTLAVLMVGRIAFRLFRSALLGTLASLLLAVDGLEFVQSRTGILDMFVMFWALAAFGCLLVDRDRARERLAARQVTGRLGPWLGVRPWRIAAIVCLGLCTGVKWSGIYFTAAFLAFSFLWDLGARRASGDRRWLLSGLVKDGVPAFLLTLVLYPAVYVATWVTWFTSSNGWNRQWGAEHPAEAGWTWVPDALRSLWHYHAETDRKSVV